ncbi:MAG: 2,4-dihydroxyhept-2-ene-1,7-dioic acid aldolase [Methylobacterium mesophilicum]|nr:2,4-dihydroxyhept-2-ene-1,7-dioic acid aldolase [Methylobacterium mesophilicum]
MRNRLKSLLQEGTLCKNGWLSIPSGFSAELMARAGWDSITIDLQHGVQDYSTMVSCLQGMANSSAVPLVRVPSNEPGIIGKVLDAGAWGVICPMVNSAEEAGALVASCLYPPDGARSNGPIRAVAYGDHEPYQSFANREVLVIPMIETAEAVERMDEILDVPGISGAYVGPSDLSLSLGLPPVFDHEEPRIIAIYGRILAACARRGLFAGIHTASPAYAARMVGLGFRFVTIASDASLIAAGARQALSLFQENLDPRKLAAHA